MGTTVALKQALKILEISAKTDTKLEQKRSPQYGRVLEDFVQGEVFCHPRGLTIDRAFAIEFATTYMETNPLYLNVEFAKAHGHPDAVVSPLMVMNIALSLGVQNDSEKAMANLGYYNMHFPKAVYPGDTLRALTKVLDRKERGEGKPGIVTIRTIALNQKEELVLQYDRKIMVPPAGKKTDPTTISGQPFPDTQEINLQIPVPEKVPANLTGTRTYFEDFQVGDILIHKNGRTITDEHYAWTYRVMNTHPLHYDKLYSTGLGGKMSGEPIVYGGLVFAWLCGLASRDVSENALWDLGYTEGYHTQPVVSGDTIYAISRVLATDDVGAAPPRPGAGTAPLQAGIVQFQLIGVKGIKGIEAVEKFGADLFIKENDKKDLGKEKIPEKIFEIERRLLIKKRPV